MEDYRVLGRMLTDESGLAKHIWSGSGIEFETSSSSLIVTVDAHYFEYEIWLIAELNGSTMVRTMLLPGENKIAVYKNLSAGEFRKVRIYRDSQPYLDESESYFTVKAITDLTGNVCSIRPTTVPKLSFEFIGDSLTTGEGLRGDINDMDFSYCYSGFENTYAKLVADYFEADYSVISQCGYGVACGWNNDIKMNVPDVYNYADGKSVEYDFEKKFDFVVVNLGTNDNGALYQDEYDGHKITEEEFALKAKFFLSYCLIKNPKAHIIWTVGMCDIQLTGIIKKLVQNCPEPDRVSFIKLQSGNELDMGSRQHPGIKTHKAAARLIINRVSEILEENV